MKSSNYLRLFILMCGLSLLTDGCLFKKARVPTRQFVLDLMPAPELPPTGALAPPIEIEFVKIPSYLLRDSMVIRKSATEVDVFEDALWAERLDEGFRRILEENLASLLASRQAPSASERGRVSLAVTVRQFDVDTQGRGTLIARWRLTFPGTEKPPKSELAHLTRSGQSPLNNPQVIPTTMSALIADFSQELAQAIRGLTAP